MSKQTTRRHENFPIDSFRFMEGKISKLRRSVMFVAARIAREEAPADQQIYTVEQKHVIVRQFFGFGGAGSRPNNKADAYLALALQRPFGYAILLFQIF